jgi:hypothetical protein
MGRTGQTVIGPFHIPFLEHLDCFTYALWKIICLTGVVIAQEPIDERSAVASVSVQWLTSASLSASTITRASGSVPE